MGVTVPLPDLEATVALARRWAGMLALGDVVALKGELGTGKTAFARALIQTLAGSAIDVASPTFTLLQTYTVPMGEVWHYDLYRIENERALAELALEDAYSHLTLIEWPERLGSYPMPITATLAFALHADGKRDVSIESTKEW
jgi:tRNA threonylcarbamoyladenosine biosynthesis protein TsaE